MAKLMYYAMSSLDSYTEDAEGKFDGRADEDVPVLVNNPPGSRGAVVG